MNSRLLTLAVVAIMTMCFAFVPAVDSDADAGFGITDGIDRTVQFDGPVDHIITVGKGATATAIELGCLDKIVVVDKYSNDKNEPVFAELNEKVEKGEVKAGGTVYKSGVEQLKKDVLDSADPKQGGVFDKASDAIVLTASKTYVDPLLEYFTDKGFAHILVWYDIPEYDMICDFVDKMSKVLTGGPSDLSEQMAYVPEVIEKTLSDKGIPAKKAFFVTYSSNTFKVGNTGSIATSLITAAGGDAYTVDSGKDKPTYEASLPEVYEKGDRPLVFADKSIWSDAGKLNQVRSQLPGATIVNVEPLWNNFCPDSMYGVWAMACAMYPDVFEGDVPTEPEPAQSDLVVYAVAGLVVVAAIGIAAYLLTKKKKI